MKRAIAFLICQAFCLATGFADNPRWKEFGTPIPAHTNLDVRWEVSEAKIPSAIRLYHLLPNRFPPGVISNVMALCAFTAGDRKTYDASGAMFESVDGSRKLSIAFSSGEIRYEIPEPHFSLTHLAEGVPPMSAMPELTTRLLNQIHIPLSEVTGYFETDKFNFWQPFTEFYEKGTSVTNIAFRAANFRRMVDGIPVVAGDGGGIYFGEHGKIARLSVTWHDRARGKSYPTVSRKTVTAFVRDGLARQGLLPDNVGDIDWRNIKNLTIKKARPCYYAGSTDLLYPFLVLFTAVDTGHGNVDVQIECPIIDETKPPKDGL